MTHNPSLSGPVPFAVPDITSSELKAVEDVLTSRWITTGPRAAEFESRFAKLVGAKHAIAMNSCTAALHLSLEALDIGPGDLVYMSPYTFAATGEVVRYLGAIPRFVDIDRTTLNIDPTELERRIREDLALGRYSPRAILPVHIAGTPCDMGRIWGIAQTYGLAVVEDAAHALPASRDGVIVGTMPDGIRSTACYSFYATKTITTGEGGMLVTDDKDIAERARTMCLHGLSRQAWGRYSTGGSWRYDIVAPGYKYNITDIAAALGIAQLDRMAEMRDARARTARRYDSAFSPFDIYEVPNVPGNAETAWHLYILRLPRSGSRTRDGLITHLTNAQIGTSVHFIPLHMHSYYRETFGYQEADFPCAAEEFGRVVSLPIFSGMTDHQVDRVIDAVVDYAKS